MNGLYHGQGTYTFASGNKYVGEWNDDTRDGQGTFTWADGGSYVGESKDNLFDGIGKLTYSDGRVEEGRFMIGVYIGKE